MFTKYVHGYTDREARRLEDQANTLTELLHHDSIWPAGELILEAGCGVGSQTKIVAVKNPESRFISFDISLASILKAKSMTHSLGIENVSFQQADIFNLPYPDACFDHIMVCFVLEHLAGYQAALNELKRVLKKGGSITVIEGDHGSAYFHPDSEDAYAAIQCQIELQKRDGGDANIGRKLYPILINAGFKQVQVTPRQVYADFSRPQMVEGFTKNTFTAMIEGVRENAINQNLISAEKFDKGVRDLYRTAEEDGVFCYTFFKGVAIK
jgi:ubiquinone/menaquinone biosynthesis C-methylase UbiE